MDKNDLIKKCSNLNIDMTKYCQDTNALALEYIAKLYDNCEYVDLKNELTNSSVYYYLLLCNAFLITELENIRCDFGSGEIICKLYTKDLIKPIFNFDEKFILSRFPNESKEWTTELLEFIKNIHQIQIEEISLENQNIVNIQSLLSYYYMINPIIKAKLSEYLITDYYLENLKIDKPIKLEHSYTPSEYMHDEEKRKIQKENKTKWLTDCHNAKTLFCFLVILSREDATKMNDFILNNMMNILDAESDLDNNFLVNVPKQIYEILYYEEDQPSVEISLQKKLIDFIVNQNIETKGFKFKLCEKLEDYIFENHTNLLCNFEERTIISIIIRNLNKIDKFKNIDDIQTLIELIRFILDDTTQQYFKEVNRLACDKLTFNEISKMVSEISREIPQTREFIETFTQEQIINSLYLINGYFKNKQQKNKKLVHKFNAIVKDKFEKMFTYIKNRNSLEQAYKKIKNRSLEVIYEKEMSEMKEIIDAQYKNYVDEFLKSKKFSFEKYYFEVETKLNNISNIHKFVKNKNLSEAFNRIILTYNAKEIQNLMASNEYYFSQLQEEAEGCELTPLITCLIKGIEQFMCSCIKYAFNRGWCSTDIIFDKYEHNLKDINWEQTKITCSPLKVFIEDSILNNEKNHIHNSLKNVILNNLENFIDNVRNGHFHKDNVFGLHSIEQYEKESYDTIISLIVLIIYLEENLEK